VKILTISSFAVVLLAGALVQLTMTARLEAQQTGDISKPGPQFGDPAPVFRLKLDGKPDASGAGTKISTRYLEITTYSNGPAVGPGDHFLLSLDIEPHSGIHVYAPGAKGYQVVSLSIEPNVQVRVLPMQYPVSEIHFFEVLDERVPVFQKPFRLVQELILEDTAEAQAALRGKENVAVQGTLKYQACDDMKCFFPVSVPLAWTMALRKHGPPQTIRP
jgi:hypothetical protein